MVALREQLQPLRDRFRGLLEQGANSRHAKTARFCAGMLEEHDAFWTFADVPGIGPTNYPEVRVMPRLGGLGALRHVALAGSSA